MTANSPIKSVFSLPVLIICFSAVYALDPYYRPPQRLRPKPDLVLQKNVEDSCDSTCYQNRNPTFAQQQQNITFLCGSDGFTYLNFEELNCVRRQCGKDIQINQLGRCPRNSGISSLSFPSSSKQSAQLLPPFSSNQNQKPNLFDRNFLRFLSQQSSFQTPPRPLAFPEEITVQIPVNPESRPRTYWKPRPLSRGYKTICLPAECNCPEDSIRPVCGSDSVTYGSQCLLECSRECKPDLVKYHDGYCGRLYQTTATCTLNQCNCPDDEYEDDGLQLRQPICGSDGITYGSVCLLECNKMCKPDLKLSYTGYCGKIIYPESI